MTGTNGDERAIYIKDMFARIAHRYDVMNRVMTAGQDVYWRREVIRRAELPPGGFLLDLGAGTGDLWCEALRQCSSCRSVAADFTIQMMRAGQSRQDQSHYASSRLNWIAADAGCLPFHDQVFDAVVSGFLLHNVSNILTCLHEQYRVLKPGGMIVVLDTTPPGWSIFSPLVKLHLRFLIPMLGGALTGQIDAYRYLPASTQAFLKPEQLASRVMDAGFTNVGFRRKMLGTVAIHWGRKPVN